MKDDAFLKLLSGCGWLLVITLFGIAIAIGIGARNFWVGVGVWFSLTITIGGAISYRAKDDFGTYLWTVGSFIMLLALYARYGELAHWWWQFGWLLTMFAHGVVGVYAREQKRPLHSTVAGALALLSVVAGLSSPAKVAEIPFLTPSKTPMAGELSSVAITALIWLLIIVGGLLLFAAWVQGYAKIEASPFIILTLIGLGLLAIATWLSGLRGGWWWAVAWGLAALAIGHASHELHEYYERGAAMFGYAMMVICLLLAFAIPGFLPRYLTTSSLPVTTATATIPAPMPAETPGATATPVVAPLPLLATQHDAAKGWQALRHFLWSAIRSVWGIFHLIMFFLLGYSWFRRGWAALLPLLVLFNTVWFAGVFSSSVGETLTHLISSSPAGWMRELLRFSVENFGHAGWGILFLGMTVSVILLPALQQVIVARYHLKKLPIIRQLLGTRIAYEYAKSSANPLLMMVNNLINPIILLGLLIALWVGLRQTAQVGDVPLAAWGIPDLSVPSWKPVWQLPYFALAGVCALVQIILIPLKRKFNLLVSGIEGEVNGWYILIGTFVLALFVPAGVILFLTGQVVVQLLLVPLAGREILRLETEKPSQSKPDSKQTHKTTEKQTGKTGQSSDLLQPSLGEQKSAVLIWSSRLPLVGMLPVENSQWYLAEKGVLFVQGVTLEQINLPVQNATTLLAFKESTADREGEVLIIGDGQKVLKLGRTSRDILHTFTLSQKAEAFALNPYKTLLAWLNISAGLVGGLFLEHGREVTFSTELTVTPALAFSADGRRLAVGAPDGRIHILDIATRQIEASLQLPESSASFGKSVRYLARREEGSWLAVYDNRRTVLWDSNHQVEKELSAPRRRLDVIAFHIETGRLAFGLSEGNLQVFDARLNRIFEGQVEEKQLSWMDFSPDGKTLFVIGNKTIVRKVELP